MRRTGADVYVRVSLTATVFLFRVERDVDAIVVAEDEDRSYSEVSESIHGCMSYE